MGNPSLSRLRRQLPRLRELGRGTAAGSQEEGVVKKAKLPSASQSIEGIRGELVPARKMRLGAAVDNTSEEVFRIIESLRHGFAATPPFDKGGKDDEGMDGGSLPQSAEADSSLV